MEKLDHSDSAGGDVKRYIVGTMQHFLKKLSMQLSYDPAIVLLTICLRDVAAYGHTKICT